MLSFIAVLIVSYIVLKSIVRAQFDEESSDDLDLSHFQQTLYYHDNYQLLFQKDSARPNSTNKVESTKNNTSKSMKEFKNYFRSQRVDHFNKENGAYWSQPYFLDKSAMKSNESTIFFEISGEWDVEEFFNISKTPFGGIFTFNLAKKYNAALVGLQHRFYSDNAIPTPNGTLLTLSSQQALADAAYFLEKVIRQQNNLTGPIIVSGCSYGGSLAVWFRTKYAHIVKGSIARSPPILAKTEYPEFTAHVLKIARKVYPNCIRALEGRMPAVKDLAKNDPDQFLSNMNLCNVSKYTADQILDKAITQYTSEFMGFTQQGYNSTNRGKNLIGEKFCPLLVYGNIYKALQFSLISSFEVHKCPKTTYEPCLDMDAIMDNNQRLKKCKPKDWKYTKMWDWQKCTEFGWFMTVPEHEKSTFKFLTLQEHLEYFCSNVSSVSVDALVSHTNAVYGGWNMQGASNLLIIDGEYDPWKSMTLPTTSYFYPFGVSSVMIEGANHCPTVFPIVEKALDAWLER